jgi:hypothetical protein
MDRLNLSIEPRTARAYFREIWLFMNSPLAARLPLKMFHCICDVYRGAIYPGLFHACGEKLSSRSDKRKSRLVFLITWLLSHEYDVRVCWALTEYGVGSPSKKVAPPAIRRRSLQRSEIVVLRQERRSGEIDRIKRHARYSMHFTAVARRPTGCSSQLFPDCEWLKYIGYWKWPFICSS